MKKILRKCGYCDYDSNGRSLGMDKKSVNLETDDFLRYKNKFYHTICFIQLLKKKGKLNEIEIDNLVKETKKENQIEIQLIIDKDKLTFWIYENYNITVLPSSFFNKLDEINNGSYKGLSTGINNDDILNIFKKMKLYLDKNAEKLKNKGKGFKSITERINYDLSVVINNYDKYKGWKKEQESQTFKENEQDSYVENKRLFNNKIRSQNKKITDSNEIDIVSIIDELF
jgi:hypothetical protein